MFNEFEKPNQSSNSSTNSTEDLSDCQSPGKFNCDDQVAKVSPFIPQARPYQPQEAFNSALFFNVEMSSTTLAANGQETMPELNEADMLGSDLLDALDEDVETDNGALTLN